MGHDFVTFWESLSPWRVHRITAFLNLRLPVFGADSAATALAWKSIPLNLSLFSSGHFCCKGTQTAQKQEFIVLCC
jgi:hypothetical protein